MEIGFWLKGVAGIAVGAAIFVNLPTRLWLTMEKATLAYLAETSLQTIDEANATIKASQLWEKKGAVVMVIRRPG